MKHAIDYLNARRDAKPASGGTRTIRLDSNVAARMRADANARRAASDTWSLAMDDATSILSEFRLWASASRAHRDALLAPGESAEDLEF
jgi:hypothetical protein